MTSVNTRVSHKERFTPTPYCYTTALSSYSGWIIRLHRCRRHSVTWSIIQLSVQSTTLAIRAGKSLRKNLGFLRATAYAIASICYCPSVCPSVCSSVPLSVTRVDQSKTVEVRIMQLSPPGSPMTLVSSRLTSLRNYKGNLGSEGAK